MYDFEQGAVLLIDKPLTWTSFDVVNKIRYAVSKRAGKRLKVGHAGTLDPLATGLLIICTGKQTRNIDQYQAQEKEYTGTFYLGATTPSFDAETLPDAHYDISHLTPEQLHQACTHFLGDIAQIPPIFSAIKVGGKPVYKDARKGKDIVLEPRNIHISLFELTRIALPEVDFRVICSKGTYIRSLARDFGQLLGAGAYLSALRRTRIGEFRIEEAHTLTNFLESLPALPYSTPHNEQSQ